MARLVPVALLDWMVAVTPLSGLPGTMVKCTSLACGAGVASGTRTPTQLSPTPTSRLCSTWNVAEPRAAAFLMLMSLQQYPLRNGLLVPEDLSVICPDRDPAFAWCKPEVSHIQWDYRPLVHQILRWTKQVAKGRDDREQTLFLADFIEGGTIGPAPGTGGRGSPHWD